MSGLPVSAILAAGLAGCWFDVADVEPGASDEALVGGGVDYRRRPTHRTGRAVESNDEAVRGGL
jgi:hypothetical protein